MKKQFFLAFVIIVSIISKAQGQAPYVVSVRNEVYKPLDTATSITQTIWVDPTYSIPLGFNFKMVDTLINHFNMASYVTGTDTASIGKTSGFMLTNALLWDRGIGMKDSVSPIRYRVTGPVGNRIFKFEMYNAGFFEEYIDSMTNNDSLCLQVWLYEDSSIFEYHFGPSKASYFSTYFGSSNGLIIGYVKNFDIMHKYYDKLYQLSGSVISPIIDSSGNGLSTMPPSGTVYRFKPNIIKETGTYEVKDNNSSVRVYPTLCLSNVTIENAINEDCNYKMISSNGKVVYNGLIHEGITNINIHNLPRGTYLLIIETSSGLNTYKIIKQ